MTTDTSKQYEAGGASDCSSAPLWQITEIGLESQADCANPYADADVSVRFDGPGGAVIDRPAFWDGGRTWKIRFAPTTPGTWRWSSVCSNPHDAGLHARSGKLTAAAVETDIPLHRHGFLRVSPNGRHFVHADGTPFFWLGDTHWQMPDRERVDACNHQEHAGGACPHGGQFQHLLADRIARGFNVYQTYPNATSAHWWAELFTRIDPERFREVFDVQMDALAEAGMVIALGCGHFNNATKIPEAALCRFARYRGYYDYRPTRPVLETEAMYELVDCGGVNTTDEARQSAWKSMLCGSPGYTYGGAGIWFIKWDADDPGCAQYNHAIGSWYEGMDLPGAAQMTVLKRFFLGLDWTELTPRFNDPAWAEWNDPECCALATIGNRLYLAYCYGESSEGLLRGLDPAADYTAAWIDPRTGEETVIAGRLRPGPDGAWTVPAKPAGDWLLRVSYGWR